MKHIASIAAVLIVSALLLPQSSIGPLALRLDQERPTLEMAKEVSCRSARSA